MTNKICIRKTSNIGLIHRLDREIFHDDTACDLLDICWYIAWIEGEPAGFGGVFHEEGEDESQMVRCGVLERFRGNGIQRALLRTRERFARKSGAKYITTYTMNYNISSGNNLIMSGYLMDRGDTEEYPGIIYWRRNL